MTRDLQTLTALQRAHLDAIPCESLDPLLGRSVRLEFELLQEKMVRRRRGRKAGMA